MFGLTMDQLGLLSVALPTALAFLVIYFTQAGFEPVSKEGISQETLGETFLKRSLHYTT